METLRSIKPYQELANHVVLQAVDDYRKALRGSTCYGYYGTPEEMIQDCERFFKSSYFQLLTNLDEEHLIHKLKEEYRRECNSNPTNTQTY